MAHLACRIEVVRINILGVIDTQPTNAIRQVVVTFCAEQEWYIKENFSAIAKTFIKGTERVGAEKVKQEVIEIRIYVDTLMDIDYARRCLSILYQKMSQVVEESKTDHHWYWFNLPVKISLWTYNGTHIGDATVIK